MKTLTHAILVLIVTATGLSAQSGEDSWENLRQLQPGHKIKVVDMDLKAWDGRLVSVSDEAVTIRELRKHQEVTVERAKVLRVRDLQRSRRGRNALIGLAVGGLAVTFVPHTACGRRCSDCAEHAMFILLFGGIGAGVGAAIPDPRPVIYGVRQKPQGAGSDHQR